MPWDVNPSFAWARREPLVPDLRDGLGRQEKAKKTKAARGHVGR